MKKLATLISLLAVLTSPAVAVITLELVESGNDLVLTANGSVDLTDLNQGGSALFSPRLAAATGYAGVGPADTGVTQYTGLSGPTFLSAESGVYTAGSGSGDFFAWEQTYILVPSGYVSTNALSGTFTYTDVSLADLGLEVGDSFSWSWGSGGSADSMTLNVVSAVPEPSTYAAIAGALALAGAAVYRRRRTA